VRILFAHQNFPGQYRNLISHLAKAPGNELLFLTQRQDASLPGVRRIVYAPSRKPGEATHGYVRSLESAVLNAQEVWRAATGLRSEGFQPDIVIAHNAWGETLFLKDVYPRAPLLGYFEFFYRAAGSDADFDPEYPLSADARLRIQIRNSVNLLGLETVDRGQTATCWQRAQYPKRYQDMISVVHEGVDTDAIRPDPGARFSLKTREVPFRKGDEIITFVARNLEPYRGFHVFMRALPAILRARPNAHAVIVGGDGVSYGLPLPPGQTYREKLLDELEGDLDPARVHFPGRIPYESFLQLLQVSAAHVYFTYPFVLSWSMLEAMSAGCLVIGSKTPPVEEVIRDGDNGLLVDFFSAEHLANAVSAVLDRPDDFRRLRERARQTVVERFDFKKVCLPAYLKLIGDLTG
jgi:glycosyltransferase involved in cell wall biosynthesis